jgi:phosphoketolase
MKMVFLLEYKEIQSVESALIHYMERMEFDERFTTREEVQEIVNHYQKLLHKIQKLKAEATSVCVPKRIPTRGFSLGA